jgi:hypothetical protein
MFNRKAGRRHSCFQEWSAPCCDSMKQRAWLTAPDEWLFSQNSQVIIPAGVLSHVITNWKILQFVDNSSVDTFYPCIIFAPV